MDLERQLVKWRDVRELGYTDFENLGKTMVAKIVFNENRVSNDVFSIFSEANSPEVFFNPNFKLNPRVYNNYFENFETLHTKTESIFSHRTRNESHKEPE